MTATDPLQPLTRPVEVGGLTFDVTTVGPPDGPVVLALHGFPQGARSFSAVAQRLAAAGLRVVAPDQRGYSPGARPTDPAAYDDDALVGDAVGLLDAVGVERAHLLGHDWGSHVAWVTAARRPDRVATLTAVSVPHPRAFAAAFRETEEQRAASAYIGLFRQAGKAEEVLLADGARRLRAMLDGVDPERADWYVERLRDPAALTAALSWYRARRKDDVPAVTVPTTYVWSDGDTALTAAGVERCAAYVEADYRLVVLPGVTHWIPEQAPDALADAVLDRIG